MPEDAKTAWNTRAAMSADPRVKVLEEALEGLLTTTASPDAHKKDCYCVFCVARTALSRSRGTAE